MNQPTCTLGAVAVAALFSTSALAADPASIDWVRVPVNTLTLFYPAQSTYQWLQESAHPGAGLVKNGNSCLTCHNGAEERLGNKLVKANKLEPTPPAGKNGALKLDLQVAYDSEFVYFRAQWKTNGKAPGEGYPAYRFDGKEWKAFGAPRLSAPAYKGEQPALYEDRFSIMIDDGSVPNFATQGCWITCHDGSRDAPKQAKRDEVAAHPFYQAIKRADVRKYLPATRTDALASWDKPVSLEDVAKQKADGKFLDLIQWRAHRTNILGQADDGYVLEWRNFDAGSNAFASNMDPKTKQPRLMFDEKKVGKRALAETELVKPAILLRDTNAVAFDPDAGWKPGDLLPQYFLSDKLATGSAADNRAAKGTWRDGVWTLVWARPMNLANPDDKALKQGKAYNFGFAVHDDNITTRGHHVSFPVTVGFGAKAEIQATRLK